MKKTKPNCAERRTFGAVFQKRENMKKVFSVCLALLFTVFSAVSVCAYEFNGDSFFSMDMPKEFKQDKTDDGYSFSSENGETLSVEYVDNEDVEDVFSVKDMTKADIKKYTDKLASSVKEALALYEISAETEIISAKRQKLESGDEALVIQLKTTAVSENKTQTYYQKLYEFGGINNKFTFTFTTESSERANSFDDAFSTIDIHEAQLRSDKGDLTAYAVVGVITALIVVGIIKFIKTPTNKIK